MAIPRKDKVTQPQFEEERKRQAEQERQQQQYRPDKEGQQSESPDDPYRRQGSDPSPIE
ncbi:hypothetical protein BH10PSE7_BH10PSE7_04690 [soil metagenome]